MSRGPTCPMCKPDAMIAAFTAEMVAGFTRIIEAPAPTSAPEPLCDLPTFVEPQRMWVRPVPESDPVRWSPAMEARLDQLRAELRDGPL